MVIGRDEQGNIKGGGSGAFTSDNTVLTAKHVAKSGQDMWGRPRPELTYTVVLWEGSVVPTLEKHFDSDNDLAVLVVDTTSEYWLEVADSPGVGAWIYTVGSPESVEAHPTITWGRVSRENFNSPKLGWERGRMVIDCFATSGNSGGPIIYNGRIVAVAVAVFSTCRGMTFCDYTDDLDPDLLALF